MFKFMSKILSRPAESDSGPLKKIDKLGNTLTFCAKCKVPVARRGAVYQCINGCYMGETLFAPSELPCEENNYNPLELHFCEGCCGDGSNYFEDGGEWFAQPCVQCQGNGISRSRRHSAETEHALSVALSVVIDDDGWTKCPRCNFKFFAGDPAVWNNGRHRRCGQKLCASDKHVD